MSTPKILLLQLVLILFIAIPKGSAQDFGPNTEISLLTVEAGEDLYSIFGHTGIRLMDPDSRIDIVYNYGTFDFDTPNFYTKFVKGKLMYQLSRDRYADFERAYKRMERSYTERPFELDSLHKAKFIEFIQNNYKKENREYLYDFFYDNCATRVRDICEEIYSDSLVYPKPNKQISLRQMLAEKLKGSPWTHLGINLILGTDADRQANFRQQMFLPDYLESNLSQTNIASSNISVLGAPTQYLAEVKNAPVKRTFSPFDPLLVLSVVLLLFLILGKDRKVSKFITALLFFILGLGGCLFIFMWLGTDHFATHRNWTLLWMNPLHFLSIYFLYKGGAWSKRYFGLWKKYIVGIAVLFVPVAFILDLLHVNALHLPAEIQFFIAEILIFGILFRTFQRYSK